MSNHQHTQSAPPRDKAPAYFVPKIEISLPPELTRLLAELEAAREKCAAFRGRYDGAEEQKAAREETRAAIVARIAEMGSQAAAVEVARFMGVAGEPVKAEVDLAQAREELAAVDREIAKLESVKTLAPSLFPPLLEELEAKRAALLRVSAAPRRSKPLKKPLPAPWRSRNASPRKRTSSNG